MNIYMECLNCLITNDLCEFNNNNMHLLCNA